MSKGQNKPLRIFPGQGESGIGLLEIMGAMAAGLLVVGAALQALSHLQLEFAHQQKRIAQQQDLRLGLELLEQELRLAGAGSLSTIEPKEVEFSANVHGLMTKVTAPAFAGQTALTVEDGSGWPDRKAVRVCWSDHCEQFTLARAGQKNLLTLTEPARQMIPAGAAVMVMNRVRYYGRPDTTGSLRLLRQIDGGASVLVGDIQDVTFSYWDESGQFTTQPGLVRRIVVQVTLPRYAAKALREISLRT
ncbi:hypothetical protein [Petrachloros mirabilis]